MCVAAVCTSVPVAVCCGDGVCPEEETSGTEVTQQPGNRVHIGITDEAFSFKYIRMSALFFFLSVFLTADADGQHQHLVWQMMAC